MDEYHHNRYFKDIDYNTDPSFRWADGAGAAAPAYLYVMKEVQEAYVIAALRSQQTVHITELAQLEPAVEGGAADVVLWHDTDLSPREPPAFKPLADYMMIWHEWYRTAYDAAGHRFRWDVGGGGVASGDGFLEALAGGGGGAAGV